jgi:hypothetical protein
MGVGYVLREQPKVGLEKRPDVLRQSVDGFVHDQPVAVFSPGS